MARAKNGSNGHLEEALAKLAEESRLRSKENEESWKHEQAENRARIESLQRATENLLQIQAQFVQSQAGFQADLRKLERDFRQVMDILADHTRILAEHGRILEALPDAVRERMGSKPPQPA